MAVFFLGEVFAGVGERGTAAVETVGVVNLFAAGCFAIPTYPSWYYYAGQA